MKVVRYFHIRTDSRRGGATVRVCGDTEQVGKVDVQVTFVSNKDLYCRKTGRDYALAAPIKSVPLRALGSELRDIEHRAISNIGAWFRKHPDETKTLCRDWAFAIRYFLPKA